MKHNRSLVAVLSFAAVIAAFAAFAPAAHAATYYLSPSGSDSNSGTSASSPWASPDHAVSCGDVISAAAGTYSASNFGNGRWGTVSCAAGNNVAMLKCATFDGCKVTSTSGDAMWIDKSYWGVEGWEASTNSTSVGACFHIGPSGGSVNHVVFIDDVANGCRGGGFNAYDSSKSASVDYIAYVGNIAYNTAGGSGACYSGFNVYQPIASDQNAGTHMYVGGNFSYDNTDGDPCAGTAPTDGEGINFDTWDFSQGGGTAYTQQGEITNNIEFGNGGDGIEVENNSKGAPITIENNTMYGDRRDMQEGYCSGNGDLDLYNATNVTTKNNLIYTGFATNCGGQPFYAITVANGGSTDSVANTWFSGVSGNNLYTQSDGSFALGAGNTEGTNPSFANATDPGAPNCSGTASVPACMASVIADYTPTVAAAKAYGYQAPTGAVDPLFPAWLCNVGIPSGLVNENCGGSNGGGTTGGGGTTTPPPDTTAPSVPTNLAATAVSTSQINLSWTASTDNVGVTGYKIFRGGTQIGTASTNSYQSTGLSASTNYSYTVSAYDAAGNNSAQSASANATTQAVVVTPPPASSTTVTAVKVPFRIAAGTKTAYTDPSGNLWSADEYFTGGSTFTNTSTVSNTTAPVIYKTERYGLSTTTFSYNIPIANGSYTVNLDFAETYLTGAGQRIFSVSINGATVLSNFDIYASAGGKNIAVTKTFNVTVTNGTLNISFVPGSIQDPKVDGIEVLPLSAGGTTTVGTSTLPNLGTIGVGASVITLAKLNVRQTAGLSGTLLGTEALGSVGTVAASSQSANGYTWWKVNYANGTDGWSVGNYLSPYTTSSQAVGVNISPSSAASQLAAMEVELSQLEALYQSLIGH